MLTAKYNNYFYYSPLYDCFIVRKSGFTSIYQSKYIRVNDSIAIFDPDNWCLILSDSSEIFLDCKKLYHVKFYEYLGEEIVDLGFVT